MLIAVFTAGIIVIVVASSHSVRVLGGVIAALALLLIGAGAFTGMPVRSWQGDAMPPTPNRQPDLVDQAGQPSDEMWQREEARYRQRDS